MFSKNQDVICVSSALKVQTFMAALNLEKTIVCYLYFQMQHWEILTSHPSKKKKWKDISATIFWTFYHRGRSTDLVIFGFTAFKMVTLPAVLGRYGYQKWFSLSLLNNMGPSFNNLNNSTPSYIYIYKLKWRWAGLLFMYFRFNIYSLLSYTTYFLYIYVISMNVMYHRFFSWHQHFRICGPIAAPLPFSDVSCVVLPRLFSQLNWNQTPNFRMHLSR